MAERSIPWRPDPGVAGVLLLGLAIRAFLLPSSGYGPDIAYWKSHLTYATAFGIDQIYSLETPLQPYPPLLLYLLWGIGLAYRALLPGAEDTPILTAAVKLPAVLGDLLAAGLLARYAGRRGPNGGGRARIAAAVLALHPALIWLSAYWGQVDVLHGGLALAAILAAHAGRSGATGVLLALAALTKPQGLIILPAVGAFLIGRTGLRGLARAAGWGVATALALSAPFLLAGYAREMSQIYLGAAEQYPHLSVYAFNPWWIVTLAFGGGREAPLVGDALSLLGPVTPRTIGLALFAAASLWIVIRCHRRGRASASDPVAICRLLTLQWLAFFLLPTQVHERYLAPAILSLAPVVALDRRARPVFAIVGIAIWLNVVYVLPPSDRILRLARVASGEGALAAAGLIAAAVLLVRDECRPKRGSRDV